VEVRNRQAALCVFTLDGRFLLAEIIDPATGTLLHRPPGGGMEAGETPDQAVRREVMEELGIALDGVRLLGSIDHVWHWKGRENHERAWIFLADPSPSTALAEGETPEILEADGDRYRTFWCSLAELARSPVCPAGLADRLAAHTSTR
jgi:8-oxo-dGTP pyrophosphatase MutT (NUDIX family)